MRIDVIGAGPAGLYFAILAKKAFPDATIDVVERNRPDDTFGFGIVLSDETLSNLRRADEPSYREIADNFAYWDDIYVQFRGHTLKSSGHGFSGIKRIVLLNILQRRAEELGIRVRYQTEDAGIEAHLGADLVVAADGINSAVREKWVDHFQPEVDLRPNKFVWLGAEMNLPGFFYSFREDAHGHIWNMHAYQYTPGECTLVIETTGEAWDQSGLTIQGEADTAKMVETIFADDLRGAPVLTNRSHWRNFPSIKCRTWYRVVDRGDGGKTGVVLIGDAAHTAHWSIGSGTKLALEDAIALCDAVVERLGAGEDVEAALAAYEQARYDESSRIQHSANVSLRWFEDVARFWDMEPIQFNASLLTRSKQITYENLRMRDPALVDEITRWWNQRVADEEGIELPAGFDAPPLFAPLTLRGMRLVNRVVVSPMAQYSAVDGMPSDWHMVHYGARAVGGAGLVFVEMTCPSPEARITPGCTGLWNEAQAGAWKRIVDFVHGSSEAKICMQLGHAGRKGSTQLGWEQMDRPLEQGNWPLVAPSALPYYPDNQTPREMTRADMDRIRDEFVHSTRLAAQAGFDMLELHMAHGYLLASFISPVTNRRTDAYGGSLENRLRWPLEVFEACRAAWPADRPMSVRISATDWIPGGMSGEDSVQVARWFKERGCDLIDVSTGQTDPAAKPVYGRMWQASFSEQIRLGVGIRTMAVGAITSADQCNTLLVAGRADLVALARPHLADPYFTLHAAADAGFEGIGWPKQYLSGAQQAYTLARRAKEDAIRKAEQPRPPRPEIEFRGGVWVPRTRQAA